MAATPKRPKTEKLRTVGRFRLLRWIVFLTLSGVILAAAAAAGLFLVYATDPDLPRIERASDYRPKVVTKVMSADGELIGEIFEERRTVVPREKISPNMIHAIVDAEDAQFYEHGGLSYMGMLRAILRDIQPGAHMQGASTLTQQLVRNLILKTNVRTLKRKVQEIVLARRLESALTKDEILWLYLTQIEFGHQRFGVEEAARFYFGKSIADVNAGEAALLASLPKGPTEIDPWKHAERAKDRQKYVLSQMVRYKHLTAAEAEKFAREPIAVVRTPAPFVGVAPEFVDEVKKMLVERVGQKRLPTLGAVVTTTCDARIQKLARDAVEKGLIDLDARQGYRKPLAHWSQKEIAAHHKQLEKEFPDGPGMGKIVEAPVTQVASAAPHDDDGVTVDLGGRSGWLPTPSADATESAAKSANGKPTVDAPARLPVDRYNPKGLPVDKRFTVGDVLRVRVIEAPHDKPWVVSLELGPQSAAVVIDPTTRDVKALVGGYGYRQGGFDRAISAKRQPGSSFKPFVYATAFATGKWTPASVLIDGPQTYTTPGLAPWRPMNAEKEEYLGPVRLRVGLARSLNTIASQLVDVERGGVEPATVVTLAHDAGIESELEPNPSLALGTSVVSPLELTNAYATFAAGGKRTAPRMIVSVSGEPAAEPAQPVQAMKPELAYLVTSMLTSVIEEGTAASARGKLKRPAAGKTGTTNARKDAWFVGFTPELVTGVWVGFDDMREMGHGEQGARAALPMWVEIMSGALKNAPPQPFSQPPGIVVQKIDPKSGLLAAPNAPNALEEVFMEGTAPTEVAPTAGEANPDTYIIDQQ